MLEHEVEAFRQALRIGASQITAYNILERLPQVQEMRPNEVVLVGGAGDFSVLDDHPFLSPFFEFFLQVHRASIPTFASCFGFQALCVAFGGEIVSDEANKEVGSYEIFLTDAGKKDTIFGRMPAVFVGQLGHKDRAQRLPEEAVPLAFSARAPFQAFKMKDKPIYATQFHPELTMRQNRERFERYIEGYSDTTKPDSVRRIRESFRESRESYALLPLFVQEVVLA